MRTTKDTMARILLATMAFLGSLVLALVTANGMAAITHTTPHIGDIVTFAPAHEAPPNHDRRLIVHRPDQFGCVLDLATLRQSGGSLIVESLASDTAGSFHVHWAGERTSADTANCGRSADLILDGEDLDILALSAGGYGTGRKRLPLVFGEAGV